MHDCPRCHEIEEDKMERIMQVEFKGTLLLTITGHASDEAIRAAVEGIIDNATVEFDWRLFPEWVQSVEKDEWTPVEKGVEDVTDRIWWKG